MHLTFKDLRSTWKTMHKFNETKTRVQSVFLGDILVSGHAQMQFKKWGHHEDTIPQALTPCLN